MNIEVDALMLKHLIIKSPSFLSAYSFGYYIYSSRQGNPCVGDLFGIVDVLQGDIFTVFLGSNVKDLLANYRSLTHSDSFIPFISTVYKEPISERFQLL